MWNYTGDLRSVEWGTKARKILDVNVTLLVLDTIGHQTPNVSQYIGRCFGSWNRQSRGQVMFTLNPIEAVDNQVFIFKFVPNDAVALDVFDVVQLIVKGKNFYYVMNCCFIMESSMKFWNGQVMPLTLINCEGNNFNVHCEQKKCCHEK